MLKNIIFLLYISTFLSILFIYFSSKGLLGLKSKHFVKYNNLFEAFFLLILVCCFILFSINVFYIILLYFYPNTEFLNVNVNPNSGEQDPNRWLGIPQILGILAGALIVYKCTPGSNRQKAIIGLIALVAQVPLVIYFYAVENADGFNKLMFSMMEYKRTGSWPINDIKSENDQDVNPILDKLNEEALIVRSASNLEGSSKANSSTASFSNLDNSLFDLFKDLSFDKLIEIIMQFFRPVPVEGHLDDLLGLQLFIYFLMLIVVISLIILLFGYMTINIFLHNKEFILSKFNNKYLLFMVRYQILLGKISLFTLPLLILFGLIEIAVGLHYLITHSIAWAELPVDLHTYISSTKSK